MKKTLLLLSIFVITLSLSGCSLFKKKKTAEATKKAPINEPVNVIDTTLRPFVSLVPSSNGRNITLNIDTLPKKAAEMEYELEYQAGTLLQGAFGSIDLSSIPTSTDILLGSCSAGGACSYHEDVKGGSLTMKFRADENYALKTEWRYIPTNEADGQFSSRDSKLQIQAGKVLDKTPYVIVMQTSGLPSEIDGQVIAGPYGIFTSGNLPQDQTVEVSVRLSEDSQTATIHGWDGSSWQSFDTTVADKTATAEVDLMSVYVVTQ